MTRRRARHIVLATLMLPTSALIGGCGPKGETQLAASTPQERVIPIAVGAIKVRAVERTIEVVGDLKGWDEVTIGAKRPGRIAKILHDMGDRVKPGEPLLELEPIDTDLAVEQAQRRLDADLAKLGIKELPKSTPDITAVPSVVQAKVALERARLTLARERALINKGAGTGQDFQNAENDEKGAIAAYDNAVLNAQSSWAAALASKVALDVAKQTRVDLTMRVPSPSAKPLGIKGDLTYAIVKRTVSEGQMVKEGEALFDLVIENPLRLWCTVPEVHAQEVTIGQEVRVKAAAGGNRVFVGKVVKINPAVDPKSRTFQVEASFTNDDGKLRPGGFAKSEIIIKKSDDAITVPSEAVRRFEGTVTVFVVGDDNVVRPIPVTQGLEGDGWVEILGDLPKAGRVAIDGLNSLARGTKISIRPKPSPEAGEPKAEKKTDAAE